MRETNPESPHLHAVDPKTRPSEVPSLKDMARDPEVLEFLRIAYKHDLRIEAFDILSAQIKKMN